MNFRDLGLEEILPRAFAAGVTPIRLRFDRRRSCRRCFTGRSGGPMAVQAVPDRYFTESAALKCHK